MFNLQGSELFIVLLLALVVLGPEKLPEAMRRLGNFYAQLRKMSNSFQQEFRAAVDEPMREVRQTANTLRDSVDFRKLQEGERQEKPKSGEMAAVTPPPAPAALDVPIEPPPAVPDVAEVAEIAGDDVTIDDMTIDDMAIDDMAIDDALIEDVAVDGVASDDSSPPVDVAAPPTAPAAPAPDADSADEPPEVRPA